MSEKLRIVLMLSLLSVAAIEAGSAAVKPNDAAWVGKYGVSWDSPSRDSLDSMPLSGRCGAGANVWVQDGSIWLYLAHNAAYDESGRLLKLGCVRITPADKSLAEASKFKQILDPASGTIHIRAGEFGAVLWFAGETLMIETTSAKAQPLEISFGTWRDQARSGLKLDMGGTETVQPDKVAAGVDGIMWSHNNADYAIDLAGMAKGQGVSKDVLVDPTDHLVFGGALVAEGGLSEAVESAVKWQFWEGKAWTAHTQSREKHVISIALRAQRNGEPGKWLSEARAAMTPAAVKNAKADEAKRWAEFWSRSHIVINPGAKADDRGWQIGRNYQLFRYMLACNQGGALPLLFNGGIFTTDDPPGRITGNNNDELPIAPGAPSTPDFRRWLYCHFMSQNQRWLGWPTLASGDKDLLAPTIAFYRDRSRLSAARARTMGAEGVMYPEPMDVWGLCCVAPQPTGQCGADHLLYDFSMMLEHAWMALQGHNTLGTDISKDLPWIEGTVKFYDTFYRAECKRRTGTEVGPDGKLVIYPSNGLELTRNATNPIEVVCGLRRITSGLLALPELPAASRVALKQIESRLPDMPIGTRDGKKSLLVAKAFEEEYNKWELPELYAAWPYRFVGVTKPETVQMARDTWDTIPEDRARLCKQDYSWMPIVVDMAALGMVDEAKNRVIEKLSDTRAQVRFPAFFGPGHDWLPDHNWGGSGMTGLQEMLIAADPNPKGKIYLFPAWPKEWNVDFKLHTSGNATIECIYKDGKVKSLKVTPASRARDIVNMLEK